MNDQEYRLSIASNQPLAKTSYNSAVPRKTGNCKWIKEVIQDAEKNGIYKSIGGYSLFPGTTWVEDQQTGIGHVEGSVSLSGENPGYYAKIVLHAGFEATLYMSREEIVDWAKKNSKYTCFDFETGEFEEGTAWRNHFDTMAENLVLYTLIMKSSLKDLKRGAKVKEIK